jgi:muramoyltetrapeptide carboxypeptidase LdcA involved in peptidoglycan recycling
MTLRKITFIAPSTCLIPSEEKRLFKTAGLFRRGLGSQEIVFGPYLFSSDEHIDHVTASADERTEVFKKAIREMDIIISVAGGTGAEDIARKIDRWDLRVLRERKPLFIGFSDFTFLLSEIYHGARVPSIYFPFLKLTPQSLEKIRALLEGEEIHYQGRAWLTPPPPRRLSGIPIGGNLTTFVNVLNRKNPPKFGWRRHILFLEDCSVDVEDLHRHFAALRRHGVFKGIRGIVVGVFNETGKTSQARKEQADSQKFIRSYLRDVLRIRQKQGFPLPILTVSNLGHDIFRNPMVLPIGGTATITKAKRISFRMGRNAPLTI